MGVSIGSGVAFGIGPPGSTGAGITPPPTSYSIQYLVVAGGGGVLAYNTTLVPGTTYTITVGAGGAGGTYSTQIPSSSGCNSSITGGTLTGIVAIGGGSGQGGSPGGSGGGNNGGGAIGSATGYPSPAPLFYTPTGAQGYPGTIGGAPAPPAAQPGYLTGGGGGGGGGTNGSGGVGYTWPYTATTYAGGGAGGVTCGNSGGPGGGGARWTPGTPGKGGGGGGADYRQNGYSGGDGVVIIAVPTPNYPGAYGPQATTPPSAPGMTVITFTAPGTYTA